ncbi:MAG: NADH-quinone oxidoreductase subunit H [Candidatus Tritonobacter lacicola]|nr:NADH-quinone oxidoreductase subunit H [Candidatus Tritonobacter lacicola]
MGKGRDGMTALLFYVQASVAAAIIGLITSWYDRKLTARIQWRVGPPFLQPFFDFLKLLGKETIVPAAASRTTFIFAPLFGLASVGVVAAILMKQAFYPGTSFVGDLIVVIYFLAMPPAATIIGGFASGNPLASTGASREMKLILAYELPFILAIITAIIKTGTIEIGQIVSFQAANGSLALSLSGALALAVGFICMQAKLGFVPFDMAEAETEIMAGTFIEYSGPLLAALKLTKFMMFTVMPCFLITLFMGGFSSGIIPGLLKYIVLVTLVVLVKNTNPRLRIDQAVRFFWGPVTGIAIAAIVLAFCGY